MDAPARELQIGLLDRDRTLSDWLGGLPPEIRDTLLRPREANRLLDWAERFLTGRSPEALAELRLEAYRLARAIEERAGLQASLRYLRDGVAQALAPCVRASPQYAEAVCHIVARISDAAWEAHADVLEEKIQLQHLERLQQELMIAKRIQERLLPRTVPHVPGFDIAGRVLQAREVGGDYWSCKSYPEDDIVTLKLADVTGHGIAAATLVAAVKFISGGYYRGSKTAAQVMERTNHVLVKETPHEILVTMVYAWLYPRSREMTIVNAGHSPVWHYHAGRFRRIEPTGLALGMIETRYSEVRLSLEPGDLFFTCSDGVTEPSAELKLGEEWVLEQVAANADLSAPALVDRILEAALAVYETPRDDMSILVVRRTE
jgi:serine phosphatase RsbU (regulator of sigma subunit)